MKIVSIITARGGSKGIPKKNVVDLNGNPLVYVCQNYSCKLPTDYINVIDKMLK